MRDAGSALMLEAAGVNPTLTETRRFQIVLIKPSHYDDDGYVIQWVRSGMPANSLAVLYGLAREVAEKKLLGPDVAFDIVVLDEPNMRIKVRDIVARFAENDNFGFVGMVGVQSNEFPRAVDIARPLREAGIDVVIGGFHVSGCLAMLPEIPADIQEAMDLGIGIFAGEAEERFDELIRDIAAGEMKPVYNYMTDLPDLADTTRPFLPSDTIERVVGNVTSFDAGRGCPYQCSFCTIINVQGRKSRYRTPDSVEKILRENLAQGIDRFFITDDNFARNKQWEAIFDRIIELRERDGLDIRFMIQVDTLCHRMPNFIEKAHRAGVTRVFIGLENINPANLLAAKKRQNKITEYRQMVLAWKAAGIMTYAGYILGFPEDTPDSIRKDIDIIQQELALDALEFFILTPLPGSEDHQKLAAAGVAMDADMNRYELEHVVTDHPKMSRAEWQAIYTEAWDRFYSPDHIERMMRRAAATGINTISLSVILFWFYTSMAVEKVHPLQGGFFRLKFRTDRRPGLPVESIPVFYLKYGWDILSKHARLAAYAWRYYRIRRRVSRDPDAVNYTDTALTVIDAADEDNLQMLNQTAAARSAVKRQRKVAALSR